MFHKMCLFVESKYLNLLGKNMFIGTYNFKVQEKLNLEKRRLCTVRSKGPIIFNDKVIIKYLNGI